MEITSDYQGSEVNVDSLPEDLEVHQDVPAEIMIDISVVDSLVILQKTCPEKDNSIVKVNTEKKEFLSAKDVPIFEKVVTEEKHK